MGKNLFNVVDRFSVELSLERRLLYTTDPRYPAVAVFAHLPHLVIHISSDKVQSDVIIYVIINFNEIVVKSHGSVLFTI